MNKVVVTGIGALTPVGHNAQESFDALVAGKNGIGPITYFDTADFKFKLAGQIKDYVPLDYLDKTTVRKTDLFVQYGLIATGEAIKDSGIEGNIDGDRLGVIYGTGVGGFNTFCDEHKALLEGGVRKVSPQFIPKMICNIAAGNIAIKYGAHNSCIDVSTACASGTNAIGEAYRLIRHGYADAVICGGTEATITPLAVAGFGNCQALSSSEDPSAASLPFDKRRGGFVIGEGAGTLILEEYEHAKARGAKIYAEICGYGSTCDAYHVTAPSPDPHSSAKMFENAVEGLEIADFSRVYINAHGTGTHLNDSVETKAIKSAFGDNARKLHISSTKSMTGHMLGAAGAFEAVVAVLSLINGVIPPTINLLESDPECDLDYTKNTALKCELDYALSDSLGFGGHNAAVTFRKL